MERNQIFFFMSTRAIVTKKEFQIDIESFNKVERGGDIGFRDSEIDLFCLRESEIFYFSFRDSEILLPSKTEIVLLGLPRY